MLKGKSYFIKLGSCFHGLAVIPFIKNNTVFTGLIAGILEQSKKNTSSKKIWQVLHRTKLTKLIRKRNKGDCLNDYLNSLITTRLVDMTITVGQNTSPATSGVRESNLNTTHFIIITNPSNACYSLTVSWVGISVFYLKADGGPISDQVGTEGKSQPVLLIELGSKAAPG